MTDTLLSADRSIDIATRYLESGDFEKGGEIFQRVLQSDATNCDAMFGLGVCCHLLGNTEEAERYIIEAARLGSKEASAYLGRPQVRQEREQAKSMRPVQYILIACGVAVAIVFMLNFWRSKILWQVVGGFLGAALGSFFGALVLQYATKFVAKFKPAYWTAYKVSFVSFVSTYLVGFIIGFIIGLTRNKYDGAAIVLSLVVGYFIQTLVYIRFLRYPDGTDLRFKTSCYISLLQLVVSGAVLMIVSIAIVAIVAQHKS